jgi:TolA-binding protein
MKASIFAIIFLSLTAIIRAADAPPTITWSAKDITGADVKVPGDTPTIVAFIRPDQDQSKQVLQQIQSTAKDARVIVILSGPTAETSAREIGKDVPKDWSVVSDTDFDASGQMDVHVWPTTLVVKSDGTLAAHLAGMSGSIATDLPAYLDLAVGKIDQDALNKRLAQHDVVSDSPQQQAARHLQVAMRLLDSGQVDEAKAELLEGLKNAPQDPALQITCARAYVIIDQPKDALDVLSKITPGSVPQWQINLLKGRALLTMEKWSDAEAVLPDAIKLNPEPAEAHYLLGICYQHDKQFERAAEEFRLAFERIPASQKLLVTAK